jgi:DNA mismatch repair protein MutL
MADIIELLPDSVANQIAAGEVIQRPASVVKELVENSIDAGSTSIKLIIKDAGKTLIQVIDNGCGMSETDARLSFERHATSKIKAANDLFAIRTKGFRGEALASIAAIAHVEMKTKRREDELGIKIIIEGSSITSQEPDSCSEGTCFSVKNLFFNVPARRNFLKSNPVETKHIIEELQRVALAHPEVAFTMHNNGNEVFNLPAGSLRQRVVSMFNKNYNQRLVPVEEETDILKVTGFVGKPEFAKKTRGEQYFFVNNRFIKSPYLNHAISTAYDELISKDHFPSYFLFLDIDPSTIDINIHPTKTEVKFEDERALYAIIHSSVKQSLGKYNIAPSLDFEQETSFNVPLHPEKEITAPIISTNKDYNPFNESSETATAPKTNTSGNQLYQQSREKKNTENWQELYKVNLEVSSNAFENQEETVEPSANLFDKADGTKVDPAETKVTYQLHKKYILTHLKSGFMVIDQQKAHERILYEQLIVSLAHNKGMSQQELFPETIEFSITDYQLLLEMEDEIKALGFDIADFGNNTIAVNGIPADAKNANAKELLESLLEQFKFNVANYKLSKRDNLAQSLARSMSIKPGQVLTTVEMNALVDQLFACEVPYYSPGKKPTIVTFTLEELDKRFEK